MSTKWPFIAVIPAWAALVSVIGYTSLIHFTPAEPVILLPITSSPTIANNDSVSATNYSRRPTQPASTLTTPTGATSWPMNSQQQIQGTAAYSRTMPFCTFLSYLLTTPSLWSTFGGYSKEVMNDGN